MDSCITLIQTIKSISYVSCIIFFISAFKIQVIIIFDGAERKLNRGKNSKYWATVLCNLEARLRKHEISLSEWMLLSTHIRLGHMDDCHICHSFPYNMRNKITHLSRIMPIILVIVCACMCVSTYTNKLINKYTNIYIYIFLTEI